MQRGLSKASCYRALPGLVVSLALVAMLATFCGCEDSKDKTPTPQAEDNHERKACKEITAVYRSALFPEVREKAIEILFVYAHRVDGECGCFVEELIGIAEENPRLFFAVSKRKVELYEAWLVKLQPGYFTDFTDERDLNQLEDRRIHLVDFFSTLKVGDPESDRLRKRLVDRLMQCSVRRVW